jgi:hypothetical protein
MVRAILRKSAAWVAVAALIGAMHVAASANADELKPVPTKKAAGDCGGCSNCRGSSECDGDCDCGCCDTGCGCDDGCGCGRGCHGCRGREMCPSYGAPHRPDLFYNYYLHNNCGVPAHMYVSPVETPPHVGHTYFTYQPMYPHEWMYKHHRTYVNYYDNAKRKNVVRVHWR